ncbi:hypothetical protein [Deinococcus ruber]|uniref:hypothetical protein n=1 Tax=Deinococcus ruber TaxID=1848197 RepID=UPI001E39C814|nr:hypothetical protein [Deinococcus ruber]
MADTRQGIEHIFRRLKVFRVLKGVYRRRCRLAPPSAVYCGALQPEPSLRLMTFARGLAR